MGIIISMVEKPQSLGTTIWWYLNSMVDHHLLYQAEAFGAIPSFFSHSDPIIYNIPWKWQDNLNDIPWYAIKVYKSHLPSRHTSVRWPLACSKLPAVRRSKSPPPARSPLRVRERWRPEGSPGGADKTKGAGWKTNKDGDSSSGVDGNSWKFMVSSGFHEDSWDL